MSFDVSIIRRGGMISVETTLMMYQSWLLPAFLHVVSVIVVSERGSVED